MNLTLTGYRLCKLLLLTEPTVEECEERLSNLADHATTRLSTLATIQLSVGPAMVPPRWQCIEFAKHSELDVRYSLCWRPGPYEFDVVKGIWRRQ